MGGINGKIGEIKTEEIQIFDEIHPPVILTIPLKQGDVLEAGSIIASKDGENVLYDPSDDTQEIIGVLLNRVDTNRQQIGNVLVHGVVVKRFLRANGEINDNVIKALNNKTIWTI